MLAARALLRRFPALEESWPLRQVRAARAQRSFRAHPRRMAAWFRDTPDLRTRAFVSNLEMPEAPDLCRPTSLNVSLLDDTGRQLAERRFKLGRNESVVCEIGELLPAAHQGHVRSGQVRLDLEAPDLGSSRAYLQWYDDASLTSTHEKFGLTVPAVGGYWTVPNVSSAPSYRVHLAVVNLLEEPYTSDLTLIAEDGRRRQTALTLAGQGSTFVALEELFEEPAEFLDGRPGTLAFGNNLQPAMYYYFIRDEVRGTWRVQHL